ncbi:MAG: ABC transporter permease subunit [Chitinivibrionales bacterium]|nr:ABC transporter permease subunit [Chitinivibrionales bacterium]MBD3356255.1 ABC transporter permease subunit [Chitinivibrionales bacterium]
MIITERLSNIRKDTRWLAVWTGTIALVGLWDLLFLNKPAMRLVVKGFFNTFLVAGMVTVFVLLFGWIGALVLDSLALRRGKAGYMVAAFVMNLIRSIPQVVGVLFGYVFVAALAKRGALGSNMLIFTLMALIMSVFVFSEMVDLMRERIEHFRKRDFYNAMLVCGVSENRIINFNILWKNSRVHIFNKLISVIGTAVFLQCSVDFIISVGLSTDVSAVSLPPTLGSLLAKIDSKQDILAIGHTLTHPLYAPNLFLGHLQGITVAFLIVFTLLCIHKISNGYAERHHL